MATIAIALGHCQRRLQRGIREPRQRGPHVGDVGEPEQVPGGDPQQLPPPYGADGSDRVLGVLTPTGGGHHLLDECLGGQRCEVLPQHLHALRLALQQVGGIARGGEQGREPLRDLALVAQRREVPRGVAERLAEPSEPEEPGVGVGCVGEPLEHDRQQRALDRCGPRDTGRERLEVAQRRPRVEVAERRQPRARRLRGQPGVVAGDPGDRGEQRPVEELLVEPAHLPPVVLPRGLELGDRVLVEPHAPGDPAQARVVLRHDMGPSELVELDPVLEGPQERIGVVHRLAVRSSDVGTAGQLGERAQRGRRP
jgi:hypothetical protein